MLSGQVKIYKLSPRGDEQILHLYGPGETFGEAAMWAKIDFPAHAEAVEDARLLVVEKVNGQPVHKLSELQAALPSIQFAPAQSRRRWPRLTA